MEKGISTHCIMVPETSMALLGLLGHQNLCIPISPMTDRDMQ
jgi:hypothetical protein